MTQSIVRFVVTLTLVSVSGTNLARACGPDKNQACPANESTMYGSSPPSLANDGSLTTGITHTDGAPGVCAYGVDTMHPWWMVDFNTTYSIASGTVWNRAFFNEVPDSRLDGFQIWVGNSSAAYNAPANIKCFTATTTEHNQPPYTHSFNCTASGRYLYVVLSTGQCLTMREVEVYPSGKSALLSLSFCDQRCCGWVEGSQGEAIRLLWCRGQDNIVCRITRCFFSAGQDNIVCKIALI